MATIEIRNLDAVRALLAGLGGELAEVDRLAQNQMAYELMAAEKDQMRQDLDRPTPWTVGALRYKKAGVAGGDGAPDIPGAAVHFATPYGAPGLQEEEWLGVQSLGGQTAGPKRSELAFRAAGLIRAGVVWVPADGVRRDSYGNVPGSVLSAMIADLKRPAGAGRNFVAIGRPPDVRGVLAKVGDTWYPYLWFITRRQYQARFDFYGRADREVAARFGAIWGEQLDRALARLT